MEVKVLVASMFSNQEQEHSEFITKSLHKEIIINTKEYMCTLMSNGYMVVVGNNPLQLYHSASQV